ncbi:hypothetical protein ACIA49_33565 [Kribbella sp. NPDC051587]|uniref:hypothetical protein n=1 Tax=Kribbella sp. NPDC051587 TaxID=3364119 RepID=UPI003792C15C
MNLGFGTRLLTGIVALSGAAGLLLAAPASASPNGQHPAACSPGGANIVGARVWGTDRNGNFAETDSRAKSSHGCSNFPEYWFKGNVTVRWYFTNGRSKETHHYIPVSQPGSDWFPLNYS